MPGRTDRHTASSDTLVSGPLLELRLQLLRQALQFLAWRFEQTRYGDTGFLR
jgi:hypothetical protein